MSDSEDEAATQLWRASTLMNAYKLTSQDLAAMTNLREGTAMLIGVSGARAGERILLWRDHIDAGRDVNCLIHLADRTVSRRTLVIA